MVTRGKQGEFHTTRPGEYKIESLRIPKPIGRKYTKDEMVIVDRIKKLDARQRSLAASIRDKENLFRQRFFVNKKSNVTRPGVMEHGSKQHKETTDLTHLIDNLANSFRVATYDKAIQIRYLEQWIMSNNMKLKKNGDKHDY